MVACRFWPDEVCLCWYSCGQQNADVKLLKPETVLVDCEADHVLGEAVDVYPHRR